LSSMGTMVKVVNGKVQCRLCSKYPSCRWSPVCVAARCESKVNVMGGPADSPSLLSDHPLQTSKCRLNLARSRETDCRHCQENRSPVFSYERSPIKFQFQHLKINELSNTSSHKHDVQTTLYNWCHLMLTRRAYYEKTCQ